MFKNKIGTKGIEYLTNLLSKNSTLGMIDISHNRIMNEGFVALISSIENKDTVTSLNVSSNEITREGIQKVKAILTNTSLKVLEMNNNPLKNKGLECLSHCLK